MAKTTYQLIPPDLKVQYDRGLLSAERFVIPAVRRKIIFASRKRKKGLTEKSLIPVLAPVWASLATDVKNAWNSASTFCNLKGFSLFVKDKAFRIKNEISGYATPSDLHQALVGELAVNDPATHILIEQDHPISYYIYKKVKGTRNQYVPFLITENFNLPLQIKISYKSDLTSVGDGAFARFYAVVFSHYQGRTIETRCTIEFPLSHDWQQLENTISSVQGVPRYYSVFIEIFNAQGTLLVDNIFINHSAHNWARDPFCNDINQGFTKSFYQVAKHWVGVDIPDGAGFESVYYP